ncbi:MAG: PhoH family protein [Acidobacteria bacterium]|nr:PhoH family protein [Acidobacteriota bacterium]
MYKFVLETDDLQKVFGSQDKNLKALEKHFGVEIAARGSSIMVAGELRLGKAIEKILRDYAELLESGHSPGNGDFDTVFRLYEQNAEADVKDYFKGNGISLPGGKSVRPKSANQKRYVDLIRNHDIVFAIGPAGTGKTYIAMAMALERLRSGSIKRIVLCRPALEAGEKLGFLPGDLVEKVNPYLRPLYDALYDLTSTEIAQRYIDDQILEIAPLAFMRGRTLAHSFIILDEAQNTTSEQMKMFLTRIGIGSNAVITGDITQIDLEKNVTSGLVEAEMLFQKMEDIAIARFDETDVVRHPLVRKIIKIYEENRARNGKDRESR